MRGEGGAPRDRRAAFPPTRKSLGQHFLTDRRILGRIADALQLQGHETVLEIGPGRGALTDILAERAGRLIAIEYDRALAACCASATRARGNVLIAEADVLESRSASSPPGRMCSSATSRTTSRRRSSSTRSTPPRADRAVYLVQREVAQRLVAPPGGKEYGALTVNVAAVARAETLFGVPAGAFTPPPKVESAVVRITPLAEPLVAPDEEQPFRVLVQGAFGMRRKQMRRVVRSLYSLDAEQADALLARAGIEPEVRPETLSVEQFVALMRAR